jgi:hypothetical protein
MRYTHGDTESTFSLRASLDHYEVEEITLSQAAKLLGKAPHQPSTSRVAADSLVGSA